MKKLVLLSALMMLLSASFAQEVSSRAKAMRMMNYSRAEYMIKDVKVYCDTMTIYSLADYVIYPFGKYETVEQYITADQLHWYREVGYKTFYDSMSVSVNSIRRLDGSFIDIYRSIHTGLCEVLAAKITDPEIVLDNGLHAGVSKDDVFHTFFTKYPKSYTSDVAVLKVVSGAGEVYEIYTFKGNKLRHIAVGTKYKYY